MAKVNDLGAIVDDKGREVVENSLSISAHRKLGETKQHGTARVAEERTVAVSLHFIYPLYISIWNAFHYIFGILHILEPCVGFYCFKGSWL